MTKQTTIDWTTIPIPERMRDLKREHPEMFREHELT